MPLVTLRHIQLGFGGPLLLEDVSLTIERGERVCMVGRNGEGKSTLMKVITGELPFDEGERIVSQGTRISRLTQDVPEYLQGTVFEVIAGGLGEMGSLIRHYHELSLKLADNGNETQLKMLSSVQHELESVGGWQIEQKVETVISRLSLDADVDFQSLSGGLKRRVLLAQALVQEPDLLLLDEPTNHLDLESINWLEEFLNSYQGALLFITHDRMFLRRLATRIIELDRGKVTDWPGDYDKYLQRKEELLNAELKANTLFDKKLSQEEAWIRQGIKARRTRNEGRVRALQAMRQERQARRVQQGRAHMVMQETERSGKLVVEAADVAYAWKGMPVIRDFSTTIISGDRVGVIGPNGVGKTTLLSLLLGRLQPDSGKIRLGQRLEVAYFDQLRSALNDEKPVVDNVADGDEKVTINGQTRHVISYLQDFLFTPDRARQPVKSLSGGERNRLLLARLFSKPANVLVMDEPTNDLDVETLELLEELLMNYRGTLLLVSHDRTFINNVVTSTLVFEGDAIVTEYVGGYDDWLRQRQQDEPLPEKRKSVPVRSAFQSASTKKNKKLSYKDQRELERLPKQIEELEQAIEQIHASMSHADFYQQDGKAIAQAKQRVGELETELEECYQRWEQLEAVG